jgi:hypothetical protein
VTGQGIIATLGVNGTGSVSGNSQVGLDTFISGVSSIAGTNQADTYDAHAYTGPNNSINLFLAEAGNDQITGNGNTIVYFADATAAIAATLGVNGSGTVSIGNGAVGIDTITGGVNNINGSNFADTFTLNSPGATFQSFFTGNGGNDNFVFNTNSGHATIGDFHANTSGQQDTIDLTALGFDQQQVLDLIAGASGDTLNIDAIHAGANTTITLSGIDVHQLHLTDFKYLTGGSA